jgi:HAD superfamily hydrolase (TIGR01484 family)
VGNILLCSDLDRTILPNGVEPESPKARQLLRRLGARDDFTVTYVSGRNKKLLQKAILEYEIPIPDYAIGDVGTTIYEPRREWAAWVDWEAEISRDWAGLKSQELEELFADLSSLHLQEPEKQNTYKLSYYTDPEIDALGLRKEMERRLAAEGIRGSIIWSVDEQQSRGLLDLLPEKATKLHAIRFLVVKRGFSEKRTVFAGDSGNDLPALTGGLQAVLVKNAPAHVRREAERMVSEKELGDTLYFARGGFLGMNGNYCAGVLEGLAHFIPETREWMAECAISD